ncbi:hypothetical protein NMY22_g12348 [Coprinellus aureogranulatus]|nr:hypothetical protein NMY22_g12348 [Coprinellus aureogranulatus]
MTFPNLEFGEITSWMTKNTNSKEGTMNLATLKFYKKFIGDKRTINNIVKGLSFEGTPPFYNAATADPTKFVARFLPSDMLEQYELVSAATGDPVVGIAIGSFVRSSLRGPITGKERYRGFVIIPHRGWYERFASFHCMNFRVDALQGQRVENMLTFQTRNKPDGQDSKKKESDEDEGTDTKEQGNFSDLEPYDSPRKPSSNKGSAARRHLKSSYKFDEEVPILDGRGVKLDFSTKGLNDHLDTLPEFKDRLTLKSPCVVGYNTYGYVYKDVWRVKFNILFVIVIAVAGK